jgi:transcription elongation factor Elf1
MGRRRRRIVKVVKKKLPTVFSCPSCGEEAVRVVMSRSKGKAIVQCAACGLKQEVGTSPSDQMVDVYCRFTDQFYGVREPSTPIPPQAPTQIAPEGQAQPETQEKAPEGAATEEIPQSPQEQPDEPEAAEAVTEAEETASEDAQGEEVAF